MITPIYNILGMLMTIWYVAGYRWTMQGNELGKFTNGGFMLNWWFAPINMATAFLSAYFIVRALIYIKHSFTRPMLYIATFLVIRNLYYTIEDTMDYLTFRDGLDFFFIFVDLAMAAFAGLWLYKCKEQGGIK